jgi:hypothetical protein
MSGQLKIGLLVASLFVAGAMAGPARAADVGRNLAAAQPDIRQMLPLMPTDANGRVSKQEFMNFMAAAFASMDVNRTGALDVSYTQQPRIAGSSAPHR